MNRNSIRRATTCCLTAAVVLTSSSFVSQAAMGIGTEKLVSVAAEAKTQVNGNKDSRTEGAATAGLSQLLSQTLAQNSTTVAKTSDNTDDAQAVEKDESAQEAKETKEEVPAVKTEYDNIAIAQVDNYVNVRSAAGEDSEVLGKLYNNSACTVLGTEGDWYQIHSGDVEGYIKAEFLVLGDAELAQSVGYRVADVQTENLNVRADASTESDVLGQVPEGEVLSVVEEKEGWVKVAIEEGDGWVSSDFVECSTHYVVAESKEAEEARLKKEEEDRKAAEEAARRATGKSSAGSSSSSGSSDSGRSYAPPSGGNGQAVANYACQFVGNPYVYGGTSLTNGADCSGFVMSVYAAFGVSLPHSSSGMQGVGYGVSADAMQPGDIICYSGHVGIYIGGDTIVHASTEATGIKYTSPANYRSIIAVRRIF